MAAAPIAHRLLGLTTLQPRNVESGPSTPGRFAAHALERLHIALHTEGAIGRVPKEGGLLVVANHPFGGLDGLALLETLQRVRGDVKASVVTGSRPFPS